MATVLGNFGNFGNDNMAGKTLPETPTANITENLKLPDNRSEKVVCKFMLFSCLYFIAATTYGMLAPRGAPFTSLILTSAAVAFVAALVIFLSAAFRGTMCGQKDGKCSTENRAGDV